MLQNIQARESRGNLLSGRQREAPTLFSRVTYGNRNFVDRLTLTHELEDHTGCVNTLFWSSRGDKLLSGSDDTNLCIYNTYDDFSLACKINTGHQANIFSAKFMPCTNDSTIISCAGDDTIRVFDITHGHMDGGTVKHSDVMRHNFRCHSDRVKRLAVEEGNPHVFLSCSEDGSVRQYDLRMAHKCSLGPERRETLRNYAGRVDPNQLDGICDQDRCPPPLADYSRYQIDLNTLSLNKFNPQYFIVAGSSPFVYLHDRRMTGKRQDMASLGNLTLAREFNGGTTRCIKRFAPCDNKGQSPLGSRSYRNMHVTAAKFAESNGREILGSWSSDYIYLFDMHDSPMERAIHESLFSTGKKRRSNPRSPDSTAEGGPAKVLKRPDSSTASASASTSLPAYGDGSAFDVSDYTLTVGAIQRHRQYALTHLLYAKRRTDPFNVSLGSAVTATRAIIRLQEEQRKRRHGYRLNVRPEEWSYLTADKAIDFLLWGMIGFEQARRNPEESTINRPPAEYLGLQCPSTNKYIQRGWRAFYIANHYSGRNRFITRLFLAIAHFIVFDEVVEFKQMDERGDELPRLCSEACTILYDLLHTLEIYHQALDKCTIHFTSSLTDASADANGSLAEDLPLVPQVEFTTYLGLVVALVTDIVTTIHHRFPQLFPSSLTTSCPYPHLDPIHYGFLCQFAPEAKDKPLQRVAPKTGAKRKYSANTSKESTDAAAEHRPLAERTSSRWLAMLSPDIASIDPEFSFHATPTLVSGWARVGPPHSFKGSGSGVTPLQLKNHMDYLRANLETPQLEVDCELPIQDPDLEHDQTDSEVDSEDEFTHSDAERLMDYHFQRDPFSSESDHEENIMVDADGNPINPFLSIDFDMVTDDEDEDDRDEDNDGEDNADDDDEDVDSIDDERERRNVLLSSIVDGQPGHAFGDSPVTGFRRYFKGHCNVRTVKDVNFYGTRDEYVVSGSDDGRLFIWDKKTSKVVQILKADSEVVNVVQGHPLAPTIAASGIDSTIKIFSPSALDSLHRANNKVKDDQDLPQHPVFHSELDDMQAIIAENERLRQTAGGGLHITRAMLQAFMRRGGMALLHSDDEDGEDEGDCVMQ